MLQLMNIDPKNKFDADLAAIFGPPSERRHISTFTTEKDLKDLSDRINKLPEYVCTKSLGQDPSLFQVTNHILTVIQQTKALKGIDLDWQTTDDLKTKGLIRHNSMYKPAAKIVKNNDSQRGIQLRNLVWKILFRFKADAVQTGLARYSPIKDLYYLNDAQHRYIACVILGIREIPLEYKISEFESDDVRQYKYTNLSGLPATNYDKYRNRVQTIQMAIKEDPNFKVSSASADPDEIRAWNVYNILEEFNAECIEQGGKGKDAAGARQSTGVGKLIGLHEEYGHDIFRRAIMIHTQNWYEKQLKHQNVGGTCEFIRTQEEKNTCGLDATAIDLAIIDALDHRYKAGKGQKVNFYQDVVGLIKKATLNTDVVIQYEKMVAAGLYKIIVVTDPNTKWAPIKSKRKDIAHNYLKNYRVMAKT